MGNEAVLLRGWVIFFWEKGLSKEISQRLGVQQEETSVLLHDGTAA